MIMNYGHPLQRYIRAYASSDFDARYARLKSGFTIEHTYQQSKRDRKGEYYPSPRGKQPFYFSLVILNGDKELYSAENAFRHGLYNGLWYLYLLENPHLWHEAILAEGFYEDEDQIFLVKDYRLQRPYTPYFGDEPCNQEKTLAWIAGQEVKLPLLLFPHPVLEGMRSYWERYHKGQLPMLKMIPDEYNQIEHRLENTQMVQAGIYTYSGKWDRVVDQYYITFYNLVTDHVEKVTGPYTQQTFQFLMGELRKRAKETY